MSKEELIAKSAINVFAREGFHEAKVQQIANEASVAVGTIYNYFKSKEDILNYILEKEYQKRIDFLRNYKDSNISTIQKIQGYLEFNLDMIRNNSRIARVLAQQSEYPGGNINNSVKELRTLVADILLELIVDGQNKGEIRKTGANILRQIIRMTINGAIFTEPFDASDESYRILKNEIVEFIKRAIQI